MSNTMNDTLRAVERLKASLDRNPALAASEPGRDLQGLLSRLDLYEKALRPFAEACKAADEESVPDTAHAWESAMAMIVTFGDFRTALQTQEGSRG